MKSKLIPVLIANLFAVSAAFAADSDFTLSGSVGVGLRGHHDNARDAAKENEFRDLGNGGIGVIDIQGRGNQYYLNFFGENIARDDQYLNLQGGQYGVFKYQLFQDKIIHNLTWDALTPFSGIGTGLLTGPTKYPNGTLAGTVAAPNIGTWNRFDYLKKRENYGGNFELTNNSPWFVRVDANENTQKGIIPFSYNGTLELPQPVDYKTSNISVEGGYASKRGQFSVSALKSRFSNNNDLLRFTQPGNTSVGGIPGIDTGTLPPDNDMTKFAANGVLRQLPGSSTLAGRLTYTNLTNSIGIGGVNGLANTLTNMGTTAAPNYQYVGSASPAVFNGDIKTKTASLSLTSNPTKQLDTKVYWNWYQRGNGSTQMAYNVTTTTGTVPWVPPYPYNFNYKKYNVGADLGYRIDAKNKVSGGLDYADRSILRDDFDRTKDTKVYAEYKNTVLDTLSARVKYQYLDRRSDFLEAANGTGPTDPLYLNRFGAKFDVANVNQDLFKLILDMNPAQFVDIGLEFIYKGNKYGSTVLGRTKDTRSEYIANVSFGDPGVFRMTAFADMEEVKYYLASRFIPRVAGAGVVQNYDPIGSPAAATGVTNTYSGASYNWGETNKDRSYTIGIGADWPVKETLTFKASYIYQKTQGMAEFTSVNNYGTPTNVAGSNLANFDNTTKHSLNLKALYKYSKNWDFTGGYAYERYGYTDDAVAAYNYTAAGSATTTGQTAAAYWSGYGAFPSYTAHIYYLLGTYKF